MIVTSYIRLPWTSYPPAGGWMDVHEAPPWGLVNKVLPKEKLKEREVAPACAADRL